MCQCGLRGRCIPLVTLSDGYHYSAHSGHDHNFTPRRRNTAPPFVIPCCIGRRPCARARAFARRTTTACLEQLKMYCKRQLVVRTCSAKWQTGHCKVFSSRPRRKTKNHKVPVRGGLHDANGSITCSLAIAAPANLLSSAKKRSFYVVARAQREQHLWKTCLKPLLHERSIQPSVQQLPASQLVLQGHLRTSAHLVCLVDSLL